MAALPDETTILNFRHLLEQHDLPARLLERVNGLLKAKGLLVSQGTMVDATIIHAPSSTKNAKGERDPEMHQTKKGKQWYFGMKIHIGADVDSGAVHSVSVTAANRADISELPNLLRETDQVVFGDAGYASDAYKRGARALGMVWRIQDKAKPKGEPRGGAFRQPEETQPEEFRHPGAGRASLPHPQAAVRLHQGALPRTGEEHRPGDGADWPGELVCVAQEVDSGIDGPTASAVRKWPTNAPGNRSIRLIEPVTSTVAPKNPISVSPSAATPIDQQFNGKFLGSLKQSRFFGERPGGFG